LIDRDGTFKYSSVKKVDFDYENRDKMLTIYPNPTSNSIYFSIAQETQHVNYEVRVFDANGSMVLNQKVDSNDGAFYLENFENKNLADGLYHVYVKDDNGKTYQSRFLLQR
jgi:hypothetical protein